jgi:hypothetical protein
MDNNRRNAIVNKNLIEYLTAISYDKPDEGKYYVDYVDASKYGAVEILKWIDENHSDYIDRLFAHCSCANMDSLNYFKDNFGFDYIFEKDLADFKGEYYVRDEETGMMLIRTK